MGRRNVDVVGGGVGWSGVGGRVGCIVVLGTSGTGPKSRVRDDSAVAVQQDIHDIAAEVLIEVSRFPLFCLSHIVPGAVLGMAASTPSQSPPLFSELALLLCSPHHPALFVTVISSALQPQSLTCVSSGCRSVRRSCLATLRPLQIRPYGRASGVR